MAQRYFTVTWDQLHRDSKALAWRLLDLGPWKGVVAITRGGLIPAAIIAPMNHRTDAPSADSPAAPSKSPACHRAVTRWA